MLRYHRNCNAVDHSLISSPALARMCVQIMKNVFAFSRVAARACPCAQNEFIEMIYLIAK